MAPGAGGKRKRGDRSWSGDSGNDNQRQSPHRPGNLNLAHYPQGQQPSQPREFGENRGRGGRRSSRGGRGPSSRRPSDSQNPSETPKDTAMSPPAATPAKEVSDPMQTNGAAATVRSMPPPSPSPAPTQNSATEPPPAPLPYAYEYATQDVVDNWMTTGKKSLVERGTRARSEEDALTLASIFQELLRSAFDGRIPATETGTAVKEIIGEDTVSEDVDMAGGIETPGSEFDPRSVFLDALSIMTDGETSNPALRPLVFSTAISPALLRLELETPLLQTLGLVRDTFARMGIRKQTNLLYRQSNYNLLREESEGYSKLLTELFTTSNNEPPSSEVVEDTFERVKAMIGAFDMDVGRVLDVTLDVFAAVLVKQYRFFVKFLRASSWWPQEDNLRNGGGSRYSGLPNWAQPGSTGWITTDEERAELVRLNEQRDKVFWDRVREVGIRAFFEIGRQSTSSDALKHSISELSATPEDGDDTKKWIEETGTLPPKGNRVAAQLLGFKLRFYSSSARNESDVLPDNLIYLAALLIKVGFISLRDLYPHLWRPDELMDALKEEKMKEKAERERAARPGGGVNALMMAGALADDTLPAPRRDLEARSATPSKEQEAEKAKTEEKDTLPEPSDQKVLLLKSLLAIGAIPESLFVLSRFPWLMDAYPELPEFIHRILHHCLSKVYGALRPLASSDHFKEQKQITSSDQSGVPKGQVRLTDAPPRRVLRWAQLDKEDTNDGTDYRFYWDDWADNIPICQNVDDVFALCSSFLNVSGHKIGQDPALLTKLARIGKDSLSKDDSEVNKSRWRDLCKRLLVPSLSLTKANPGVVNEVFDLIGHFPREVRYNMYAEWYSGQTSRLPDIKTAFDQARAETKDVLKRLSKTNIRPMARALAKIAYANPGIVINVAVSQIESYENLIEVVVECARYFTYLGYDILTWSLISSLGQKGRSRVQEGGLLTSRWLNALATFAGRTFKRYSVMNPTPVLQYVVEQLRHNNSTDLIVLEQMISSMAGIITDTNFNDNQIQAMAGGELLQAQTMLQLLDKRHESKTTSRRLMKALTDSKLAGQLLIAIAQERATCVFKESENTSELKLLGNIFDEIHRILTQYLDLLRSNLSVTEFDSFVPGLASLISEFGIEPEIAFWISRVSLCHKVAEIDRASQEEAKKAKAENGDHSPSKTADGDVEMVDDGEATDKEGADNVMDVDKEAQPAATETNGVTPSESTAPAGASAANGESAPWHPVVQELMDEVKNVLTPETWEVVGLPFYVTFWQLSLYDVHIPQKAYEDEIERQKKKVIAIGNDRSDVSMAGTQRKEREKKQITELQDRILEENKHHLKSYGQTRARLQKEKDRWFVGMRGKHDALNVAMLEQCLLPRLLLSPVDAFYCFKMLKYLHNSGTPNFRTVGLLDQLFRDQRLTALIFQCTSKEADNLGRFLNEILRDLSRWHADKAVYEKEAFGTKRDLPGFAMAVDPEGKPATFLDYEDFRRLLYKWHRLIASALKTCLNGGEYMHIRNAISILKAIVQHFPAVNWIGRDMLTSVNNLSQNDERDDVKTPAASLIGDLNRREKKWMLPQAFMINESISGDRGQAGKSRASRPQSTTPKPLSATAAEFKPTTATNVNGGAKTPGTGKTEVEDGEIEDAKMADVQAQSAGEEAKKDEQAESAAETAKESDFKSDIAAASQDAAAEAKETDQRPRPQVSPSPSRSRPSSKAPDASHPSNVPRRPDIARAPSNNLPSRTDPNLPNRPEPRSYRHGDGRGPMRQPDLIDDRRDPRDNRHPEYSRSGRFAEHDRDRSFEHGRLDRLEPTRGDRDFPPRPDDQFRGPSYRDRPLREPDWPDRPGRGRPAPSDGYHGRPDTDRLPRDGPLPVRPGVQPHPDRAELIREHPDRASLIENEGHRRVDKDDRRSHSSRTSSPPRLDDSRPPPRPERFDDRRGPGYPSRHEDLPSGPRGERPGRGDMSEPREPWGGPDLSHGRLRPPEQPSDIPSGPRGRNSGRRDGRIGQHAPPTPSVNSTPLPERQPPTGPGRRGQPQETAPSPSGPPSPAAERLDTTGIHPDRLKALQSIDPVAPPSGPRGGAHGPPSGPPPPRAPPSGPGFGGERGRGDKRFAGLNTMLQQSGGPPERGPGTSIRGRGANRQSGSMTAPSPQSTRPQTPTESHDGRPELFPSGPSGPPFPADDGHPPTRPSGGRRSEIMEDTAAEPRRLSRHSSSSNLNPERTRERDRERRGDDEGARSSSRREEHRERAREYDRESRRRGDTNASAGREEPYEPRESSSRRGGHSRDENRRRDRRERDSGFGPGNENQGRLKPPPMNAGAPPPPPPPPPGGPAEDRRWGGGRGENRERNRDRDRGDREYREGGSNILPRKRGRPGGDENHGGHHEGGGRGARIGSESKRARRGP
ncbi:THO2 plays a role in transcriptional elongation [Paecilomyces lecythidis]